MQTEQLKTAQSLYALYETLPNDIQQAFLQEWMVPTLRRGNLSIPLCGL